MNMTIDKHLRVSFEKIEDLESRDDGVLYLHFSFRTAIPSGISCAMGGAAIGVALAGSSGAIPGAILGGMFGFFTVGLRR